MGRRSSGEERLPAQQRARTGEWEERSRDSSADSGIAARKIWSLADSRVRGALGSTPGDAAAALRGSLIVWR